MIFINSVNPKTIQNSIGNVSTFVKPTKNFIQSRKVPENKKRTSIVSNKV